MRVVTNEKLVNRNRKMATRLFFFSLAVLIFGFIAANAPLFGISAAENIDPTVYVLIMPVVLIVGFVSTLISVRMTNQWIRAPRPEDALQEGLKGLSTKSSLYNYYHGPAQHVLIAPQGIFAIVTRFQDGNIVVEDDKWKVRRGGLSGLFSFFRMDNIGNPTQDAEAAADYIRYIIEDYDPEQPVQPLVVFTDPGAELTIKETSVPVLYADPKRKPSLKDYMRDFNKPDKQQGPDDLEEFIEEFEYATLD